MSNDLVPTVKPYPGWGGKRTGAGRKPNMALQTRRAEKLATQLQAAVRLGLSPLLEAYPDLVKQAVRIAKDGDSKMLMFLISLPLRLADLDDLRDDAGGDRILKDLLGGKTAIGTANIQINLEAGAGQDITGTWRDADAGAVSTAEV